MAQFNTFWSGFLAFFIFGLIGFILTFLIGGMLIDPLYEVGRGLPHGCETTYQQVAAPLPWFINMYYAIGYGSSILGALIFGQAIVKRVRVSKYETR
jgi:ABC-type antimicrobial peptide transport system permease subunit